MLEIEFFFGLGSRYSYLAFTQLQRLEIATGCRFNLRPLSSVELLALGGKSPFLGSPLSGQYEWAYRQRDAEAWAQYYGVPFVEPRPLPDDHRLMARACHAAALQGAVQIYCEGMFRAVFVDHESIDDDVCSWIASRLGLDVSRFKNDFSSRAVNISVTKAAHRAFDIGAFGVPTLFVEGKMFWGNDRLVLLEHYIASRSRI